jgi:hypothetical protein
MSASLYVQMAGRGMRVKSHTDHCLVLDFAGVVATHGPITAVQPPKKAGDGNGEAPVKVCDNCGELCAISVANCPACGHAFPEPERKKLELRDDDIGHHVIDRGSQEDDPVHQEATVQVVALFTAARLLDDVRNVNEIAHG